MKLSKRAVRENNQNIALDVSNRAFKPQLVNRNLFREAKDFLGTTRNTWAALCVSCVLLV